MTEKREIPKWVLEKHGFTTQRQFKEHFRKKLKALEDAVWEFVHYSAYIPPKPWSASIDLSILVEQIKQGVSQKEWGR